MAFMPRTMPSVGFMRDAAHAVLADVLRDLGDDVDRDFAELAVVDDADGVVDRRKLPFGELDVDGRADDLDDFADRSDSVSSFAMVVLRSIYSARGSAADTISMISLVMRGLADAVLGQRQLVDHVATRSSWPLPSPSCARACSAAADSSSAR